MIECTSNAQFVAQSRRRRSALMLAAAAGLSGAMFLCGSSARAADVHWNVTDGSWAAPANWVGGVVPGNGDRGVIDFANVGTARVNTTTTDVLAAVVQAGNTLSVEGGG